LEALIKLSSFFENREAVLELSPCDLDEMIRICAEMLPSTDEMTLSAIYEQASMTTNAADIWANWYIRIKMNC
jgi:hypothetical protein